MAMQDPTTFQLTEDNYYSNEADRIYMSNSQYKSFLECEAAAVAKLNGEWHDEPSDAMLAGSYVHAGIDGTLEKFKETHQEMFKKDGELKAEYRKAQEMLDVLQADPLAQFVLQGEHEVIVTAWFAGALWKSKLDILNRDRGRFVDIKTVKAIRDKYWDKKYGWVSFVEAYGYVRQIALYAEVERIASGRKEWLEPLILAVSKEDVPDRELIGIDESRMRMELDEIRENMPRILLVKSGKEDPRRCERCKYCRSTKRLSHVVHYMDLLEV